MVASSDELTVLEASYFRFTPLTSCLGKSSEYSVAFAGNRSSAEYYNPVALFIALPPEVQALSTQQV